MHFVKYISTKQDLKIVHFFQYIRTSIPGPGCDMDAFLTRLIGCDCRTESCDITCSCVARFGESYTDYKLMEDFHRKPIIECNKNCRCSPKCQNRLIQNGIQFNLEIIETQNMGFGLKSLELIPKLSFVCEYAGEIISHESASERAKKQTKYDMNYIFVLKEHCLSGIVKTYIDPTHIGNVGRFINHSCDPNLVIVPVRIDSTIPKLCLFSVRDIRKNEELTYDYSGVSTQEQSPFQDVSNSSILSESGKGATKKCLCGSHKCKIHLPYDRTLFEED